MKRTPARSRFVPFPSWFKAATLACAGILILILWIYGTRSLTRLMDWLSGRNEGWGIDLPRDSFPIGWRGI